MDTFVSALHEHGHESEGVTFIFKIVPFHLFLDERCNIFGIYSNEEK